MDRTLSLALVSALVLTGCSGAAPGPTPVPEPVPTGEYTGFVTVEDARRPAALSVIPGENGIRAVLQLDETVAFGIADWQDGVLFMGFDYLSGVDNGHAARPCAGRMLLVGVPDGRGLSLRGDLQSRDCTGTATGVFDLDLTSAAPQLFAPR